MDAAHRHPRDRGPRAHGGGDGAAAARKRAPLSPMVVCFVGCSIVLLVNACHTLFPKEKGSCLGSLSRISLAPGARTPTPKPHGVKYELHTLPRRQLPNSRGDQVIAKKYRIRLRGIDAPESSMPYGKEAKEELVKLVHGKRLKISLYDRDRYGRFVGDVDCDGVFVQEHMLRKGLAWHYSAYDKRTELTMWESQARSGRMGLWALPNPKKPWEWRKENLMRTG